MATPLPGGFPLPDHRRITRTTETRLRGVVPALNAQVENANQTLDRTLITMNRGGSSKRNPILSGLGVDFQFSLASGDQPLAIYVYQARPNLGPNLVSQATMISPPNVWAFKFIAGAGQSVAGTNLTGAVRNFIRVVSRFGAREWEFYAKGKDKDIITVEGLAALDDDLNPVALQIQGVDPALAVFDVLVDFMPSWADEFQVFHRGKNQNLEPGFLKSYGGAKFVSVFDSTLPIPATRFTKTGDEPFGPGAVTYESSIVASGLVGNITKVTLGFHIDHFNTNVLELRLIAPDLTEIDIVINRGGIEDFGTACTDDTTKTTVSDDATRTFLGNSNPFDGADYLPEEALSGLNGKAPNGTWKLQIKDEFVSSPGGTLKCWHVEIETDGTTPGVEGQGTMVVPFTDQEIKDTRSVQLENITGQKDITFRFRSKAGSTKFVDCPVLIDVVAAIAAQCDPPVILEDPEPCTVLLYLKDEAVPADTPDAASQPGVPTVAGSGTFDRDILVVTIRGSVKASASVLVKFWKYVQDTKDLGSADMRIAKSEVELIPLSLDSATPAAPVGYMAPRRYVIAFDVAQEKFENVAYFNLMLKDGDLLSEPLLIAGPKVRDLDFFPPGGQGGGIACAY